MLCCSDPQLLSKIAAASAQDLEPVRLEGLSAATAGGDLGPPLLAEQPGARPHAAMLLQPQPVASQQTQRYPQAACPQRPAAPTGLIPVAPSDLGPALAGFGQPSGGRAQQAGGMEAYELARRLVSSAAASGSGGGSGGGGGPGSYTSAARKVRVSVKIPDREPEELPPNWEADLRINGQRETALMLFTYMRRGCVQLVVDVLRMAPQQQPGPQQPQPQQQQTAGSEMAAWRRGQDGADASESAATSVGEHAPPSAASPVPALACSGVAGGAVQEALSAAGIGQLMVGRTVTVQVDSTVTRVRVSKQAVTAHEDAVPAESGRPTSAGQSSQPMAEVDDESTCDVDPTPPPDVLVWPAVVCCGGKGLLRESQQTVRLACSWNGKAAAGATCKLDQAHREPQRGFSAAGLADTQRHRAANEVCITARQQGRFLPVRVSHGRAAGGPSGTPLHASCVAPPVPWAALAGGGCCLELAPCSRQGLLQVEMCRGGVHSCNAASVLLLESAAAAHELHQQLLLCSAAEVAAAGSPHELQHSRHHGHSAAVQGLLRDFGVFLDIVEQLGLAAARRAASTRRTRRSRGDSCASPAACSTGGSGHRVELITWALPPAGTLDRTPVPDRLLLAPLPAATPATPASAAALSAAPDQSAMDGDRQQEDVARARQLATMGCDVGLSLLRHFLVASMPACAGVVLDLLAEGLDMPASLLAACRCRDDLSLLHHAARSGQLPPLATLAAWLEVRGVAPGWVAPAGTAALSPLHLLAAYPYSCGTAATTAALQLRWPEVAAAWHSAGTERGGCGAAPAQFAAVASDAATGPYLRTALSVASSAASVLGVGSAWRLAARAGRALVPPSAAHAAWGLWCQAQSFASPALEAAYGDWLTRRTTLFDHSFLALYLVHALMHAAAQGCATWVAQNKAGLLLLAFRLALLAFSFGGGGASSTGLLQTREGRTVVLEVLRTLLMLALAAGLLEVPALWARVVQSKIDVIFNTVMRPLAGQMRLGSSALCSLIALVGETVIMAVLLWSPKGPMALAAALVAATARSAVTHGVGLGVTVILQVSLRRRFLHEERRRLVARAQSQHAQTQVHACSSGGKAGSD
ncbi:hypothetical protein HXX76_002683 [Chlamydomonas incerta]|uniref:Uncharacterized protein n=1 Tax=Chlamydomonas incerta TaxID=51695 RepID=A0A835TCI7_CHLIN|nr:hypothetical protein HXX76_002683 [Chlamydomonas incerta]|eukprot:KAG2442598.1 hypothetical protein HXX76_002683 [Chlamydomonas incerta]